MLLGHCLAQANEHKRALIYFENAAQDLLRCRNPNGVHEDLEYEFHLKYANACIEVEELHQAKQLLEWIPVDKRSVHAWKQLTHIYEIHGEIKNAIDGHKYLLSLYPDAVESAIALLDQMVPFSEFESMLSPNPLIREYIKAHAATKRFEYKEAFQAYASMEQRLDNNPTLLLGMLSSAIDSCNMDAVESLVTKIHKVDHCVLQHFDRVSGMYMIQNNVASIKRMATECFHISDQLPEPWVIIARYSQINNHLGKALEYTKKAIMCNSRHLPAYHAQGNILINQGLYDEAIGVYRTAHRISRDIMTYEGLVHCYISSKRMSEAIMFAEEALRLMPNCSRALSLVALALIDTPTHENQVERAVECIQRALTIRPTCAEALGAICVLYEKHHVETPIQEFLAKFSTEPYPVSMYVSLGQHFMHMAEYITALDYFNKALRLDPECSIATDGVHQAERKINGDEDELGEEEYTRDVTIDETESQHSSTL
ncbi:Anaphase promoting complex subunit 7, variant 2 [Batrachochytrium dendrobatidis]|nr:Anaphase promoting complex subunit 7, variant 3 [Batrachochytrium dendrobatidis]KAK5670333.1 Anaphase promoting complex subunit 7, variant 2 [Batrachochytrium dendrobatidis]OAJ43942.1 hypothetical protein, variant 1 [Batrachochytrium dendrobatidis JEL423]